MERERDPHVSHVVQRYAVLDDKGLPQRCGLKVAYPTQANADAAAHEMRAVRCGEQRSYRCPDGHHYHLSRSGTHCRPTAGRARLATLARVLLTQPDGVIDRDQLAAAIDWGGLRRPGKRLRVMLAGLEKDGVVRRSQEHGDQVLILDRNALFGLLYET